MENPYKSLTNRHFWKTSVAGFPLSNIKDVWLSKFKISKNDRIISAGSCFAQHIGKGIERAGGNYLNASKFLDDQRMQKKSLIQRSFHLTPVISIPLARCCNGSSGHVIMRKCLMLFGSLANSI